MLELGRIRKCVIPAAGKGKRFYPLTRAQPKEMLPLLDKPVIQYVVEEAVNSGLDEILIIVGSGKEAIINYFDKHELDETMDNYGIKDLPDIYFIRQKEQKGLADAIKYAKGFTGDEDFVVLLGDTIYSSADNTAVTSQLIQQYSKLRRPVIAVEKVAPEDVPNYGIVEPEALDGNLLRIKGVVEKPDVSQAPSDLGITGIYIFQPDIYSYISTLRPGKNNELQLTDAIDAIAKEQEVYAYIINGKRYDIGNKQMWYMTFLEFLKNSQ